MADPPGRAPVVLSVDAVWKRYASQLKPALRYGARSILDEVIATRVSERPALRPGEFWALEDVSFDLAAGEAIGIVGANGAGKTTLLRMLHGLIKPDFGEVTVRGRTGALIDLGNSFSRMTTGRESMEMEAALLGLAPRDRAETFRRIMAFADIGEFIDAPIVKYSQGMQMRLGYAIAAHLEPAVLLIDEVLAVGDIGFQRKCLMFIRDYLERGGSVVLVSHDLWAVRMVCSRCIVLDHGRVVEDGDVDESITSYLTNFLAIGGDGGTEPPEAAEPDGASPDDPSDEVPDPRPVPPDEDAEVPAGSSTVAPPQGGASTSRNSLAAQRLGSSDAVTVTSARMVSEDGGELRPHTPARIEVEIDAPAETDHVVWSFTITASGQMIPLIQSEAPRERAVRLRPGRNRLHARVASLPLVGGNYLLRIIAVDAGSGAVLGQRGWIDEPHAFHVAEEERFSRTLFRIAGVMIRADVRWNTHEVEDGSTSGAAAPVASDR